jgi:hypothetical protein
MQDQGFLSARPMAYHFSEQIVIPAEAGIQLLDPGFRRGDGHF